MATEDDFKADVEAFLIRHDMKPAVFGAQALRDPKFVFDLRKGRSPSLKTIDRVRNWMAAQEVAPIVTPPPADAAAPVAPIAPPAPPAAPPAAAPPSYEPPREAPRYAAEEKPRRRRGGCLTVVVLMLVIAAGVGVAALRPDLAKTVVARLQGLAGHPPSAPAPGTGSLTLAQVSAVVEALQNDYNDMRRLILGMDKRMDDLDARLGAAQAGSPSSGVSPDVAAQVAQLQERVAQLESRPVAQPADNAPAASSPDLDNLKAQIGQLNDRMAKLDGTADAIARLQQDSKDATHDLGILEAQADKTMNLQPELELQMQVADNADAIATLQSDVASLKQNLARLGAGGALDTLEKRVAQSAVMTAFLKLDTAVRSGQPYDAALKLYEEQSQAQAGGAWPAADALAAGAPTGIVTQADLKTAFKAIEPDILAATPDQEETAGQADGASWSDRLMARLKGIVVVRRKGETAGQGPQAIVARAATAVAAGNFATAIDQLGMLAPAQRAKAQPWIDQATAHDAAMESLAQMSAAFAGSGSR